MKTNLREFYEKNVRSFSLNLDVVERKISLISTVRLILALAIALVFYFSLTYNHSLFISLFLLIGIFLYLVIKHSSLFKKRSLLQNFVRINREELHALNGVTDSFNSGKEFMEENHPYALDLDVFGNNSLFEFICRTVTYEGKNKLASHLSTPQLEINSLIERQNSIRELSAKVEFRQNLRAHGLLLNESEIDRERLQSWLNDSVYFINRKWLKYLLLILPSLTLLSIIYSFFKQDSAIILGVAIAANVLLYGRFSKDINALHSKISKKRMLLESYSEMFSLVENENFGSAYNKEYSIKLQNASHEFKRLSRYVGLLDNRLNILFMPVANFIFLYDLHISVLIEKWKAKNDANVNVWIQTLGEIDSLCSLANMSFNNPEFAFPEFSSDTTLYSTKNLGHPLIGKNERVNNHFDMGEEGKVTIITGSNMAGKSTFLRAVGVNAVLAFCGAPVCAGEFKITPMNIYSSMRISDSLKDHKSYFYAELNRLKHIKDSLKSGDRYLVLLDEMLKGTNSHDKQQGSKLFVESLVDFKSLVIVATHDLELGRLEEEYPEKVKNYCFESFLKDGKLIFDYKIRSGKAENTNAMFLMKDMDII